MTDQQTTEPPTDEQEYIPDPEKEKQAKALHFTVSIIRLLGVGLLMAGIYIAVGRAAPIPQWPGYVLIILAFFQMWFVPLWMVRQYVRAQVAQAEEEREKTDEEKGHER